MLEEIALSISTVLFFLCTLVVSSVLPKDAVGIETDAPAYECSVEALPNGSSENLVFSLVGNWYCGNKTVTFGENGKLRFGNLRGAWFSEGTNIFIISENNGERRTYELPLEVVSPDTIRLGGVIFNKGK